MKVWIVFECSVTSDRIVGVYKLEEKANLVKMEDSYERYIKEFEVE